MWPPSTTYDLTALVRLDAPSTGLHAAARNLELLRRRLAVFDSHYVAAVEVGDEPARYARPSTATFLREQLRLSAGEAKRRVDLAHAITPGGGVHRGSPPGGVSEPGGRASAPVRCPGSMPGSCWTPWASCPARSARTSGAVVEAEMATAAAKVTPADLEVLAREVMVRADPDGTLREVDHAHKHRGLRLWKKRGQAGYTLQADLDQETGEAARVVLDAWSKPAPAVPATPATRLNADGPSSRTNPARSPGARAREWPRCRAAATTAPTRSGCTTRSVTSSKPS